VLASSAYILGGEGRQLEESIADACQVSHGVALNSGTDAILLALRALDIGAGDDVIVPAMTFIASVEPIIQLGARPVFVDIDPTTYTIDPQAVAAKLTTRTKAIIVVHLYGLPADMDALQKIANTRNIPLIEDMAQALGARYKGKPVGGLGRMACLSFYPT